MRLYAPTEARDAQVPFEQKGLKRIDIDGPCKNKDAIDDHWIRTPVHAKPGYVDGVNAFNFGHGV